jgi:hypothetical protein
LRALWAGQVAPGSQPPPVRRYRTTCEAEEFLPRPVTRTAWRASAGIFASVRGPRPGSRAGVGGVAAPGSADARGSADVRGGLACVVPGAADAAADAAPAPSAAGPDTWDGLTPVAVPAHPASATDRARTAAGMTGRYEPGRVKVVAPVPNGARGQRRWDGRGVEEAMTVSLDETCEELISSGSRSRTGCVPDDDGSRRGPTQRAEPAFH